MARRRGDEDEDYDDSEEEPRPRRKRSTGRTARKKTSRTSRTKGDAGKIKRKSGTHKSKRDTGKFAKKKSGSTKSKKSGSSKFAKRKSGSTKSKKSDSGSRRGTGRSPRRDTGRGKRGRGGARGDAGAIRRMESAANMAMILGLVSLLACALAAPFAIMKGNEAKRLARAARTSAPGGATVGIVLGWIAIAMIVLVILVWMVIFGLVASSAPGAVPR